MLSKYRLLRTNCHIWTQVRNRQEPKRPLSSALLIRRPAPVLLQLPPLAETAPLTHDLPRFTLLTSGSLDLGKRKLRDYYAPTYSSSVKAFPERFKSKQREVLRLGTFTNTSSRRRAPWQARLRPCSLKRGSNKLHRGAPYRVCW